MGERWYRTTALEDLLGVTTEDIYDERLYRALDRLLPHKETIEKHLVKRLGELFELDYDLLLYDVTSTYFEGVADRSIGTSKVAVMMRTVAFAGGRYSCSKRCFVFQAGLLCQHRAIPPSSLL